MRKCLDYLRPGDTLVAPSLTGWAARSRACVEL
ncbi:hypothetical protein ACIRG4_35390 [Streptomyces sp. NPDC102395]